MLVVDDTPGPGVQFSEIAPAVAAANDGDLILVKTGAYSGFTIDQRAISVIADFGATVTIVGHVQIQGLSTTKHALLRGLRIESAPDLAFGFPDPNFDYSVGLRISNSTGITSIEDCTVDGFYSCIDVNVGRANLTRVTLVAEEAKLFASHAAGQALTATDGEIALDHCSLIGGTGSVFSPNGGNGITFVDSQSYVVGSTVFGGAGVNASKQGPFSTTCNPAGDGGYGIALSGTATLVRNIASSITGGAGGAPELGGNPFGNCGPGDAGVPIGFQGGTYVLDPMTTPRDLTVSAPKRVGEVVQFTIHGVAGDQVFLFWGPNPLQTFFPAYSHALQAAPAILVPLVTLPGSTFQFNATMGPIVSGQLSQVIYAQLAVVDAQNDLLLSGASTIIALDPSL